MGSRQESNDSRPALRWETYFNSGEAAATDGGSEILQARVSELAAQLEALQVDQRTSDEQLGAIRQSMNAVVRAGNDLTARVRLPPKESMEVMLVAAHGVDRLEEHHSDENRAWALLGITLGAALGQITELALTSKTPPLSVWMLLVFLLLASIYFVVEISRNRTRIAQVKSKTFYHISQQDP